MALALPSRQIIFQAILDEIRDRLPEANIGEGEPYWIVAQIIATAVWSVFQPVSYVAEQIFPSSAATEYLVRHGAARRIPRKGYANAQGYALISGIAGSTQGGGSLLTDSTGNEYTTDSGVTLVAPGWLRTKVLGYDPLQRDRFIAESIAGMQVGDAFFVAGQLLCIKALPGGTSVVFYGNLPFTDITGEVVAAANAAVRVPITAVVSGQAGNIVYNSTLTLGSPGTGINAVATVLELAGGADIETDPAWAGRIEDVMSEYPAGGNRSQLLGWAKGLSTKEERDIGAQKLYALGVDRAFVYPLFRGLGSADIVVQGVKGARHLNGARIAGVQDYIAPAVPTDANPGMVAMGADIKVTDFFNLLTSVFIDIYGGPGYGPDYDYAGGAAAFVVDAGSGPTRINTVTNPLGKVFPGNRISFYVGPPRIYLVARAVNVDALGFTINPPIEQVPTVGTPIYPGSSLIEPVRDALLDMFDALGPGDTVPPLRPSRYPAPSTEFPDRLNRALIDERVMSVQGVGNVTISQPAADVVPIAKQQVTLNVLTIRHLPVP